MPSHPPYSSVRNRHGNEPVVRPRVSRGPAAPQPRSITLRLEEMRRARTTSQTEALVSQ